MNGFQYLTPGLAGLTVGVVPPALDQVLIGAIDRSRNPDLKLALVLGLNESIFPARPAADALLGGHDLKRWPTGRDLRPQPSRIRRARTLPRLIACTRSRERLILTCAQRGRQRHTGQPVATAHAFQASFPRLVVEEFAGPDWQQAESPCELAERMVSLAGPAPLLEELLTQPPFAPLKAHLRLVQSSGDEAIGDLTERLYGPSLETSVSRLEDQSRLRFPLLRPLRPARRGAPRLQELDVRERGSFQHEALAEFHQSIRAEGREWRGLTPDEARARMGTIIDKLAPIFRDGLLASNPQARFSARTGGRDPAGIRRRDRRLDGAIRIQSAGR